MVDRHKTPAMTLAVRLVGNRPEAEELVQDAFVRAYRSLHTFRGDAKFGTWFYRILYNLCMTKVSRRKKPLAQNQELDDASLNDMIPDDEMTVQERLEAEELQGLINMQIDQLPDRMKSVVVLFYVQEMSYEEIVAVTDQPIGTVKTNLFRARALLRKRVLARMKGEVKVA